MGLGTVMLLGAGAAFALVAAGKKGGSAPAVNTGSATAEQLYQGAMNAPTKDAGYYVDVIKKLISMGRADLANAVYNRAVGIGVNSAVLQQAINEATGTTPATPTKPAPDVSAVTTDTGMPLALKQQIAAVMTQLGIDPATGQITGKPTAAAVEACTMVAASLEAAGFKTAAQNLRNWAKLAAAQVEASTPPAVSTQVQQKLPIEQKLMDMVNKALKMEGDPTILRQLAAVLRAHPNATDPNVQMLIRMLEKKADDQEAQQVVAQSVQNVEALMTTPGIVDASQTPFGTPATSLPSTASLPMPTIPQPATTPALQPVPKSPTQLAAEAMCTNLRAVQSAASSVKASKGQEDKSLVKRFQALAGATTDGLAGPGTLLAAAAAGACNLPYVMYWPKSATASRVYKYREDVRIVANTKPAACKAQLEASAAREKGQAGIVGALAS